MPAPQESQPIWQLELRPDKRGTPSYRMFIEALLAAAEEELAWREEAEEARRGAEVGHDAG